MTGNIKQHEILSQLDLLEQLGRMKENGIISEADFVQKKTDILYRISLAINPKFEQELAEKRAEEEAEVAIQAAEALEQEKLERFAQYWLEHSEEKAALEKKRTEAEEKLHLLGSSAKAEREQIQRLIDAIDEELTRER